MKAYVQRTRYTNYIRSKGESMLSWFTEKSSVLTYVNYQPKGLLTVVFNSGSLYQYKGVPRELVEEFQQAPSAGRYFNTHIKGKYPHKILKGRS